MSRIARSAALSACLVTLTAAAVPAQESGPLSDASPSAQDFLSEMRNGDAESPDPQGARKKFQYIPPEATDGAASTEDAGASAASPQMQAVKEAILQKIMNIARVQRRVDSSAPGEGDLTIEEIDRLNRTAERAQTELELQNTQLDRMRTELESMTLLYETLREIESSELKAAEARQQAAADDDADSDRDRTAPASGAGQRTAGQAEAAPVAPAAMERARLPRVVAITAAGGHIEALIAYDGGGMERVAPGDLTRAGLDVAAITPQAVTFASAATGEEYRRPPQPAPSGSAGPQEGGRPSAAQGPGRVREAISLGNIPLSAF